MKFRASGNPQPNIYNDLKLYDFEKEYKTNKKTSYIAPCNGDSGSGQWVTINQDTDDERRALVAVHSNMDGLDWNLNGKILSSVCGSATKFNTGKVYLESYLSTITTNDKILGFIRNGLEFEQISITQESL